MFVYNAIIQLCSLTTFWEAVSLEGENVKDKYLQELARDLDVTIKEARKIIDDLPDGKLSDMEIEAAIVKVMRRYKARRARASRRK